MTIFDGTATAEQKLLALKPQVAELVKAGRNITIASILFTEDEGSVLYSHKKRQAAEQVGITYHLHQLSFNDGTDRLLALIDTFNQDSSITGIIIQKPRRSTWFEAVHIDPTDPKAVRQVFNQWWHTLTSRVDPHKDVDGLHPSLVERLKGGDQVSLLPATTQAVLDILIKAGRLRESYQPFSSQDKIVIIGRSDIMGLPLYHLLAQHTNQVEMIGSKGLRARIDSEQALLDADVVVSATGRKHLITGEMIKVDATVIDVGEPQPDVEFDSVQTKAGFITPVPGGVGPMTVACLLENSVKIARSWQ